MNDIINFDIPSGNSSIIMVAGVGGGGSNAVNHMYKLGIEHVSFMVCNTDKQALFRSPVPIKVRLGESLTQGLGAGNKPEKGRDAAIESLDEIVEILRTQNTKMIFITAGMGGGTGTGAAPVIAKAAKELGILTVAIVTIPFKTEGRKRLDQALEGIEEIKRNVDSLLIINNENIQEIYGRLTLSEAFGKADDILATAAKGIAEIITRENDINVDFADVQTVMSDSGVALMGSARASGEGRALEVARSAMSSPLLNHNDISGAKNILINISSGMDEVTLDEIYQITEFVQEQSGNYADLIWGAGRDESLGDDISITIIATGFNVDAIPDFYGNFKKKSDEDQDETGESPEDTDDVVFDVDTIGVKETPKEPTTFVPRPQVRETTGFSPYQNTIPTTPVSVPTPTPVRNPSVSTPKRIVEPESSIVPIDTEEMERIPAWQRRNMAKDTSSATDKISRVTLKDEFTVNKSADSPSLFED